MKKVITVAIILLIAVVSAYFVATCEDNTPLELMEATNEAENQVKGLMDEIDDDVFWESAARETNLLAATIEKHKTVALEYRLVIDGEVRSMSVATVRLEYINKSWRKLTSRQLLYALATSEPIMEAHEDGKTVEVNGLIARWAESGGDEVFSACEITGDGEWDFACIGKTGFTKVPVGSFGASYELDSTDRGPLIALGRYNDRLSKIAKVVREQA